MKHPVLMIPGPTNLSEDVLRVLSEPMVGHTSPEFYEEFRDVHALTAKLFGSCPERTIVFSGSGTFGMEALFSTFTKPGDRLLSIVNGYFGDRFAEIGSIYDLSVRTLRFSPGQEIDLQLVRRELEREKYDFVTVTHIDTSTGVMNDIEKVGEVVKSYNAFYVVDMVSSMGCVDYRFREDLYDYVFTASQKCVGGPPGAVMLAFSQDLYEKRRDVKSRSYYFDLKRWMPVMRDPTIYLSTPNVLTLRALRVALNEIFEEGLEVKIRRHRELGELAFRFVSERGWRPLSNRPSPSVIAFDVGAPVAREVKSEMYRKGILIATGISDPTNRILRVGYMGTTTKELLSNTLRRIEETVSEVAGRLGRSQ